MLNLATRAEPVRMWIVVDTANSTASMTPVHEKLGELQDCEGGCASPLFPIPSV